MDLSKFSDTDLDALEAGNLGKLSDAGLDELERQQSTPKSVAEQNLAALDNKGPLDEIKGLASSAWDVAKKIGKETKAGYAGIADTIAGNDLNRAAQSVSEVQQGKDLTSGPAVLGEALGAQVTPDQIALQATFGKVAEMVGPVIGNFLKEWGEKAAVNAAGKIKSIAEALGVENIEQVGKFLLAPVKLGSQQFEPIVQATSSPQSMLNTAKAIKAAAGKQLEAIAASGDKAIADAGEQGGVSFMSDLPALKQKLLDLRASIADYAPNMGKAATNQYDAAIKDIDLVLQKIQAGNTSDVFSTLSKVKTTIGDLVFRHGSPLESKAAFNDVYHAVSNTLSDTAKNVGGQTASDYATVNSVYNKVATIVEALEGKVLDAQKIFDPAAFISAISAGTATAGSGHPILAALTAPLAYGAAKVAENFGPQAIAAGLNKVAPLVAPGLEVTARGVPVVARGVYDALRGGQGDENQ